MQHHILNILLHILVIRPALISNREHHLHLLDSCVVYLTVEVEVWALPLNCCCEEEIHELRRALTLQACHMIARDELKRFDTRELEAQ